MAQTDYQETTIDGVTYQVRMLPARRGMRLSLRVGRMLGPAAAHLVKGGLDAEADFAGAVAVLLASSSDDDVEYVLDELAKVTLADGKPLERIFDLHFAGKLGQLSKWAAFALKVQLGDFTDALASALAHDARLAGATGFGRLMTSTGASGASS